ncbi:MAG: phosphoribosylglycinamide formyltransferase [Candidatus Firestonebacteria bacterium]
MHKIAVLISGRGSNLLAIINAIEEKKLEVDIAVVISDKKEAKGLEYAQKHNIETVFLDPKRFLSREEYDKEMSRIIEEKKVDIICLAGFMRILSSCFVNKYRGKLINIHPSLLPSFPGAHGQRDALEYGVKISGVTVHFVEEGMDTGQIIMQLVVPVMEDDTEELLAKRILAQEHKIYPAAIKLFIEGKLEICGRRVKIKK